MILTRLTLHNVGAYRGAHSVNLLPEPSRPVVLFGALNGAGKTTLIEAIQLVLYGRSARYLLRGAKGYDDYLRLLINHHVNPRDGAAVNLEFTHRTGGKLCQYCVRRTWSIVGNKIKEDVEVSRDGVLDPLVTERWVEFINNLLPVQIADMFLFDGERIEALAHPEKSAEVLRTGVHALLGLDLVDNLERSLIVLDRRLQKASVTPEQQEQIAMLESSINDLSNRRELLVGREAALQNQLDDAVKLLSRAKDRLRAEGGDLAADRDRLQSVAHERRRELEAIENDLRDIAALETPLRLVSKLLTEVETLSLEAVDAARSSDLIRWLQERNKDFRANLRQSGFTEEQAGNALQCVSNMMASNASKSADSPWLSLLASVPKVVIGDLGFGEASRLSNALDTHESALERLLMAEANVAAVPATETIAHLVEAVGISEARLVALEAEKARLITERESIERALIREGEQLQSFSGKSLEHDRVSVHAARARHVLSIFRSKVATRKLESLEHRIMGNYRTLLHKQELVHGVKIDPQSYEVHLKGDHGQFLSSERLSAGERQLMATAILWSLAQTSGRELPIVVDTPLARLDGSHKHLLVENYFPKASHQVILLSTDEEVRDRYYRTLEPYVSHRYLITHNGPERTSSFSEGYFQFGDAA